MGPTSFRSPVGVGKGRFSLRAAASYFELDQNFGPIDYKVSGPSFADPPGYVTRFGLQAGAEVGLINLALNYGVTDRIEVNVNLPIVIVNARGSEVFLALDPRFGPIAVEQDVEIDDFGLTVASQQFSEFPNVDFQEDHTAGLGRISLGAKVSLYSGDRFQLALSPEFFFPSPSESELAGSDTAAVLPRLVSQFVAFPSWRLHADIGYDADFERSELRRFTWNVGSSVPFEVSHTVAGERRKTDLTLDFGVGGSEFEEGIEWTPRRAAGLDQDRDPITVRALSGTRLGNTFVDFLGGVKIRVSEQSVISGSVNVPLNGDGFRAVAVGTLAGEFYF